MSEFSYKNTDFILKPKADEKATIAAIAPATEANALGRGQPQFEFTPIQKYCRLCPIDEWRLATATYKVGGAICENYGSPYAKWKDNNNTVLLNEKHRREEARTISKYKWTYLPIYALIPTESDLLRLAYRPGK